MAIKKGEPLEGEALVTSTAAAAAPGTPAPAGGSSKPGSGSVVQSPYDQNAIAAAQAYGANMNMQRLAGSSTVGNADAFMQSRQEANATPTSVMDKYNVAGLGASATNRLSRLADALNSKKWVYTTANMGFGKEGDPRGGGQVQEIQMPGVDTAEQRQQRRMEDWQTTAATNELNTRQWLSKIAPQLEVARQQSIMQLEQQMDKVQVDAAVKALDNYFREAFMEFSSNERLRAAIQLAQTLKGLGGDDVFRHYLSQAYGVAAVDKITQDVTDLTNLTAQALEDRDYAKVQQYLPVLNQVTNLYQGALSYGVYSNARNMIDQFFAPAQPITGPKKK